MKKSTNAFKIPFAGLKIGTHDYEFDIDKTFFEAFEGTLIDDANVKATLVLDKKETMMIVDYTVDGTVFTTCDRCNDPIELTVNGELRIIYKFGLEESEDENLVVLHPESFELEIALPLYELLVVSLPSRVLHPESECNEEVMSVYSSYIINANEPDDVWDDDDEEWDDDDSEEWDDEDGDDIDEDDDTDPDDDRPIDPRWSALKNLN